ncbi:MAG: LysR family transcriptional regulator [Coriobacteriales bacterium]|nr:LysR family transcriptional regulator [Coriobacteriales bacterium]
MNSEHLRYFELAYTEGNFSAAARLVPVSHQGLTKGIKSLEKELGVTLFENDDETGKPRPTRYAHELFEFAAVFDSNMRLLQESFSRLRNEEGFTINLGCSLGVLGAFGPKLLERFEEVHSNIKVNYWESNDELCEENLRKGNYDFALLVNNSISNLEGTDLYRSPLYFWTKRSDPLAQRFEAGEHIGIRDLEGYNIAIPGTGFACFEQLKRVAQAHGVKLGSIFEMSEIFQIYSYVMNGNGLGFSNGTLIGLPVFNIDTSIVAIPIEDLLWGFSIVRLPTHALGSAERLLWDWCVLQARRIPNNLLQV